MAQALVEFIGRLRDLLHGALVGVEIVALVVIAAFVLYHLPGTVRWWSR